jgi:hypothetical protein
MAQYFISAVTIYSLKSGEYNEKFLIKRNQMSVTGAARLMRITGLIRFALMRLLHIRNFKFVFNLRIGRFEAVISSLPISPAFFVSFETAGRQENKPRSTIAGQDGAAERIVGVVIFLSELARSYLALAIFGVERRGGRRPCRRDRPVRTEASP